MRKIHYRTEEESYDEQSAAKRYNPAMVAILKDGKRLTLNAGRDDDVGIYKDKERYYVICYNSRMPYFGLDEYAEDNGKMSIVGNVFFQTDYEMRDFLESHHMKESSLGANTRTLKALLDYIY